MASIIENVINGAWLHDQCNANIQKSIVKIVEQCIKSSAKQCCTEKKLQKKCLAVDSLMIICIVQKNSALSKKFLGRLFPIIQVLEKGVLYILECREASKSI